MNYKKYPVFLLNSAKGNMIFQKAKGQSITVYIEAARSTIFILIFGFMKKKIIFFNKKFCPDKHFFTEIFLNHDSTISWKMKVPPR